MVRSYISVFLGACLSKICVVIVENACSSFLFRNCNFGSYLNESKKLRCEISYISDN